MSNAPGDQASRRSARVTALSGLVVVAATVAANFADILQLGREPLHIIVAALGVIGVGLGVWSLMQRKDTAKTPSYWMACGAIGVGGMLATAALASMLIVAQQGQAIGPGPVVAGGSPTSADQGARSTPAPSVSTPEQIPQPTDQPGKELEFTLQADTGIDLDAAEAKVKEAQVAAGPFDVALRYYGNLNGSGKGFYVFDGDPADAENLCREAVGAGLRAEREVQSMSGGRYCLRTSQGNIAWVEIVDSSLLNSPITSLKVTLSVKVWPK